MGYILILLFDEYVKEMHVKLSSKPQSNLYDQN